MCRAVDRPFGAMMAENAGVDIGKYSQWLPSILLQLVVPVLKGIQRANSETSSESGKRRDIAHS
jgi:hypothetical protein